MLAMKKYTSFLSGTTWAILMGTMMQIPASANTSTLCSSRGMETEIAISTTDFHAAICSEGYYEKDFTQCYVPTDYYYVGQSRQTGESIVVPNATESVENNMSIFKARNGNYTYQIVQQGGYQSRQAWRSLSVFENGRRIYHRQVNNAFYRLPCT
jgi:hypothetical protein